MAAKSTTPLKNLLWLTILFVAGAAVTYAMFAVFVPGPDRGTIFYISLGIVVAAELVLFGHFAHGRMVRGGTLPEVDPVRIEVHGLILVWIVLAIIGAALAVHYQHEGGGISHKILAFYAVITFLFFAATYFLYSRALNTQNIGEQLAEQRGEFQLVVPDIESVMDRVREIQHTTEELSSPAERVYKKLDQLRSAIEGSYVSERVLEHADATESQEDIKRSVEELCRLAGETSGSEANAEQTLEDIRRQADEILIALRRRDQALW